jgi:hypothetical protein
MLSNVISRRTLHLGLNFNETYVAYSCLNSILVMYGNRWFHVANLGPMRSLHQERLIWWGAIEHLCNGGMFRSCSTVVAWILISGIH